MNKILLIILLLLPFEMIYAEFQEPTKVYEITNSLWKDWAKKKIPPMQEGDYFIAPAYYARYCKGEMTLDHTREGPSQERFRYVCEYNGKPFKRILIID